MSIFNLKSNVSRSHKLEEEDISNTKIALHNEGYYDVPEYGLTGYSDERMFDGIKKFQKDKGLRVDEVMNPGGETESFLNKALVKSETKKPKP